MKRTMNSRILTGALLGMHSLVLFSVMIFLFASCGSKDDNNAINPYVGQYPIGQYPAGQYPGGYYPAGINFAQVQQEFVNASMTSSSNSKVYTFEAEYNEEVYYDFSNVNDSIASASVYAARDDYNFGTYTTSRSDIMNEIFNVPGSRYEPMVTPMTICLQGANQFQPSRMVNAYQITHQLTDGNQITYVVSPSLPLYANPIVKSSTTSKNVWIFDIFSSQNERVVTQIGFDYVNFNCGF